MGYFDDNENDSIINDVNKVKGAYDSVKSTVDSIEKLKSAAETAKAAKTASATAKVASSIAGKKAAMTATKVAAGAASGPVGWAVFAASLVATEEGRKKVLTVILAIVLLVIILFLIILAPLLIVCEKAGEIYNDGKAQLDLYNNYYSIGKKNFNDKEDFFNELYNKYEINPDDIYSQADLYSKEAERNLLICKEIIDNAIDWSFKAPREDGGGGYWTLFVNSDTALGKFFESTWDWLAHDNAKNASLDSFLNSQYPYTLKENTCVRLNDGSESSLNYYTIRDYMNGQIPSDKLNNDLNYAEIINGVSLGMTKDSFTFSEFYDKLMDPKVRRNFAELSFKTKYYKGKDSKNDAPDLDVLAAKLGYSSVESMQTDIGNDIVGYLSYDVYPYGLIELFDIAGVRADEASIVAPPVINANMLDEYENIYRRNLSYLNIDMGIGFQEERSENSKAYYNYLGQVASSTGRSAYSYVDRDNILYGSILMLEDWDTENMIYNTILYSPTGKAKILDFNSNEKTIANNKLASTLDPNFERDYSKDETVHSFYICQLDYPYDYRGRRDDNSTIKNEGCTDCCYTMAAQYLLNRDISIRSVSKVFCENGLFKSGGLFNSGGRVADPTNMLDFYGLYRILHYSTFDQTKVVSAIDAGSPCIFAVYGLWKYQGITYHRGDTSHFIIIIGYDDNYFYVLDPANRSRNKIPLKAFSACTITSWSIIGDTTQNNGDIFTWVNGARFAYSKSGNDHIYVNGLDTGLSSPTHEAIGINTSEQYKDPLDSLTESFLPEH